MEDLMSALSYEKMIHCPHVVNYVKQWREDVEKDVAAIPKFPDVVKPVVVKPDVVKLE